MLRIRDSRVVHQSAAKREAKTSVKISWKNAPIVQRPSMPPSQNPN